MDRVNGIRVRIPYFFRETKEEVGDREENGWKGANYFIVDFRLYDILRALILI